MPNWSGVGNIRPVSTTTIRPSYSTTVMFLPISPSPPSGRTRRVPAMGLDRLKETVALEHRADRGLLVGRSGHHREPEVARNQTEQRQRGLDRDRVDGDAERLV